ncbi:amino acid adenylation domain-containing protein [Streptomyces purpurascens]|uniref:non-ribosomal peptide synthetase/type I polyketide synthase n=1 Tax=Streptomyces purpurascens TaxID=1924 RepID=UPI0033FFBE37
MTFAQERLYVSSEAEGHDVYLVTVAMLIDGDLDVEALRRAVQEVTARHDSLRATFVFEGGALVQRIPDRSAGPSWTVTEADPAAERSDAVRELAGRLSAPPFDLAAGPLVRWGLTRIGPGEFGLVMVAHHIVCDGWSLGVIFRDLETAYAARVTNRGERLFDAEAPSPLVWAERERALWAEGDASSADLDFWRGHLAGMRPLALPTDLPRPAVPSGAGGSLLVPLDEELVTRLRDTAQRAGATVFMAFAAIYATVLGRYAGQDDVVISSPVAGRNSEEEQSLVGCQINMVPLRLDVSGRPGFTDLLRRTRSAVLPAMARQNVPVDVLVRELGLRGAAGRSPLMQCSLAVQNFDAALPELAGVTVTEVEVHSDRAKWDVALTVDLSGEHPSLRLEYDADILLAPSAETLVRHLLSALRHAVESPDEPPRMVDAEEADYLTLGVNPTPAAAETESVLARFRRARTAHPDHPAVTDGTTTLTYAELDAHADRVCRELRSAGVAPGARVGVCGQRSPWSVVAMLAAWKAGATYVPLDPAGPSERLRSITARAGIGLVLADRASRPVLQEWLPGLDCLVVDTREHLAAPALPAAPADVVDTPSLEESAPEQAAYVIFTSGSTGEPKGVEVPHSCLSQLFADRPAGLETDRTDVWLCTHSFAFDFSVWEIWGPLTTGGTCVIAGNDQVRDPAALAALVAERGVTVLSQTPGSLYRLAPELTAAARPDESQLRYIVLGGEALDWDRLALLLGDSGLDATVVNMYGITEGTVHVTARPVHTSALDSVRTNSIGVPLPQARCYVLDEYGEPAGLDVPGELCIGGGHVARGYLNDTAQTAERFAPDPFHAGATIYRTGDLARWRTGGELEYLGRDDDQLKVRGHRVEPAEVERAVLRLPGRRRPSACAVLAHDDTLVAFVVVDGPLPETELRDHLRSVLPPYLRPSRFVQLDSIPLTQNGKADRARMLGLLSREQRIDEQPIDEQQTDEQPTDERTAVSGGVPVASRGRDLADLTRTVLATWQAVLEQSGIGLDDNFFDVGGHSFALLKVHEALGRAGLEISVTDLFHHTTVRACARFLHGKYGTSPADGTEPLPAGRSSGRRRPVDGRIAVVGMAARLPGTGEDLDAFWRMVVAGEHAAARFGEEELRAAGVPRSSRDAAGYVPVRAALDDVRGFDRKLFGYSPLEASLLDPQQRILLECAWRALEDAGYAPAGPEENRTGVFTGIGGNAYLQEVLANPKISQNAGPLQVVIATDKDFASTRISYKLNLQGPSITVQTACSTSLVATHMAVQSLLAYESDLALAGGCSLAPPSRHGYVHEPGGIFSPDGLCRPFDEHAEGTIPGDGAGVVVLKRLEDALADGDVVHGVILGSAVNNDGARKVGYTAPGPSAQAGVIRAALEVAGVPAESIGLVEAHGTATRLGDPVEVSALREVFLDEARDAESAPLYVSAVKSNTGHLDAAAGVVGLIKAVLAVRHGTVPPIANFTRPAERLASEGTALRFPATPLPWPQGPTPRRAGISSFGIGGTNAHVIVEEPSAKAADNADNAKSASASASSTPELLTLSAADEAALGRAVHRLADHLEANPGLALADVAYTLRVGRARLPWRAAVVAPDTARAPALLRRATLGQAGVSAGSGAVLMFPGQGTQRPGMGRARYDADPVYRSCVDEGLEAVDPALRQEVADTLLVRADSARADAPDGSMSTLLAQPCLFLDQVATARSLIARGVEPRALVGHSLGELSAACVGGVLTLADGMTAVTARARLMEAAPPGAMAAVVAPAEDVAELLAEGTALGVGGPCEETAGPVIAAHNGPHSTVVSGPAESVTAFTDRCRAAGLTTVRLRTSRAFHSPSMAAAAADFAGVMAGLGLNAPRTPLFSGATGRRLGDSEAVDPRFWASQIRLPVRFSDAVRALSDDLSPAVWWETGAGSTLQGLVSDILRDRKPLLAGFDRPRHGGSLASGLEAVGELWRRGLGELWRDEGESVRRVSLPTYSFTRERCWIEPEATVPAPRESHVSQDIEIDEPSDVKEVEAAVSDVTGDTDSVLSALWCEVLGVDAVSPEDDFFDQGGHSLAALRLSARIRDALGLEISLDSFFDESTFGGLARVVRERLGSPAPTAPPRAQTPAAPVTVTPAPMTAAPVPVPTEHRPAAPAGDLTTSVYFFSSAQGELGSDYDLILAAAREADALGYEAIWTPERHFHEFGAQYPNPAVLSAALATATERIHIRAGSVIPALHNPLRLIEDWRIVDRISGGRIGVSFAPGFHPSDYVLAPDRFAGRRDTFEDDVRRIRTLWSDGVAPDAVDGTGGRIQVSLYPRPVQPVLPTWLTATSNDESFRRAGTLGVNLLTALLELKTDELADKIRIYRKAREEAGHDPETGRVTLMVHCYVGESEDMVEEVCHDPFLRYLRSHTQLLGTLTAALPEERIDLDRASPRDVDAILRRAYRKFRGERALLGDPATVRQRCELLREAGVNEIGALVDFGLTQRQVLGSLRRLARLRDDMAGTGTATATR